MLMRRLVTAAAAALLAIGGLVPAAQAQMGDPSFNIVTRSGRVIYEAYDEYISHPVEERNLGMKVSIVVSKTAKLTSVQGECDKEFNAILKELRQYLRDNGRDQSIADQAEEEYKTEKDAMTKELTNLTYSQVTGKGEGAQWIQDHYAEWGS